MSAAGEAVLLAGGVLFAALFLYSARGHLVSGATMVDHSRRLVRVEAEL